jgi:hypothetical protein
MGEFPHFPGRDGLLPLRLGHGHALADAHPQQVDLELGEGGEDVENILPIGSVGS